MLEIRRYQPLDNKVCRELDNAGIAQMGVADIMQQFPRVHNDFDDIEGNYLKDGDFIVGLKNGEVVAMGAYKKRTKTCAEFKRLRIRPDCQRKGYGETIMIRLMELAAGKGYSEGHLDTLATNHRAQALFEKLGFKKTKSGMRGLFHLYYYRITL